MIYNALNENYDGVFAETMLRRSNGEDVWAIDLDSSVLDKYSSALLISTSLSMDTVVSNCIKDKKLGKLLKNLDRTIYLGDDTGYLLRNKNHLTPEILESFDLINGMIMKDEIVIGSSLIVEEEEDTEKE